MFKLRKNLKNKDGFSLIEITISIALLAFVSAVVIKLFIAADGINDKAVDMDMASILIGNEIELLHSKDSVKELEDEYLQTDESFSKTKHFNKDWLEATEGIYSLEINGNKRSGGIYDISCTFKKNEEELAKVKTCLFFKDDNEVGVNE